jgi:hypothetical protein
MRDLRRRVAHHQKRRAEAAEAYKNLLEPDFEGEAWAQTVTEAERQTLETLEATKDLTQVEAALCVSGAHMLPLRFLMAPPLSQDQFKLACPEWQKGSETSSRPLSAESASAVAAAFSRWRDERRAAPFLCGGTNEEKRAAVSATAHMIAVNRFRTVRRMRLAHEQEQGVVDLLLGLGYRHRRSELVDQPGALGEDEFMHATQFQTADGSTHEVDVAVGLPKRTILALECKVSNDATNSVKRVNDVLKKASAWKRQWGRFVVTGALLQGVFSTKEPRRLLEEDVEVFWSHRLDELEKWLEERRDSAG